MEVKSASVLALFGTLAWAVAALGQEGPVLCANDHLDFRDTGPLSVVQAVYEDEVDLSGETAVIDILFVYTEWTAEKYGSGFRATVERMVEHASVMMLNSGGNVRLRLVGLEPAPAYLEEVEAEQAEGFGLIVKVLGWIRGDPRAPCCEAAELRDRYGADLVYALVLERSWLACGAASNFRNQRSGRAHAGWIDSRLGCVTPTTLAHEVGHNLGLVHDRSDPDSGEPVRSGGRGFWSFDPWINSDYGTIMSYSPHTEWRFSTSRSRHNGRVIGLPGEHEASDAMRWAAPYVAAYRRSKQREEPRYPCLETETSDCMADGRFTVRASYRHPDAWQSERARRRDVYLGDTATLFYFFSRDNPELLVKVLDGCAVNGHYWVFGSAGTDLEYGVEIADAVGGGSRSYVRDASDPLIAEIEAFRCEPGSAAADGAESASGATRGRELVGTAGRFLAPAGSSREPSVEAPVEYEQSGAPLLEAPPVTGLSASAGAAEGGDVLCMDQRGIACMEDGLFSVRVKFYLPPARMEELPPSQCSGGSTGSCAGRVRDSTIGDNAALFYFFTWDNPELLVKVLDGCAVNGHYWVFGSAGTDLYHQVAVGSARHGTRKKYLRSRGNPLISDTEAFRCQE